MREENKNNASNQEAFGNRLARIRKQTGYTQRALAEETGISQRMIAYYESQGGRPPADVLSKLADALNVSADKLLGRSKGNEKDTKPKNQRLLKKLLQVEKLPPRDQESVLRIIDGLLSKQKASA